MVDIRLPNITATDPASQMAQMRSYLYQMVEQLNWALSTIEVRDSSESSNNIIVSGGASMTEVEAQSTFNSIKSLIIKSADIVDAYYEELDKKFSGMYVAKSDFGEYKEDTEALITANSTSMTQAFTNIQSIESNVDEINNTVMGITANIKTGKLFEDDNGVPVYGVEVGQKTIVDGAEVFNKFARFISNRLSFYDQNGNEVSYISDYKLYITNAQITGNMWIGGYKVDTSNGIAFIWSGG